jgi:glycerophosphoryl diester phosphodiesterase
MIPELKIPSVQMPFNGLSQEDYASKMIQEYIEAGVDPSNVFPQSFSYDDIHYWIEKYPEFGIQAVYLDGRAYGETDDDQINFSNFDPYDISTWDGRNMSDIKETGINYIAPPMWVLITLDTNNKIIPSTYALKAKESGLNIITWSLERSGLLTDGGGGWYYQSIKDTIHNEGDAFEVLDVLAQDVGITAIFSDWPATVTFYANCKGL